MVSTTSVSLGFYNGGYAEMPHPVSVSYTHLDVYKRQVLILAVAIVQLFHHRCRFIIFTGHSKICSELFKIDVVEYQFTLHSFLYLFKTIKVTFFSRPT